MRNRSWVGAAAIAFALVTLTALPVAAQATKTAAKSAVPRMPDGHPDLQGTYDLATMTPMERLPGDPPSLTKEKAEVLAKAELARRVQYDLPSQADRPAPPVGGVIGFPSPPRSVFEFLTRARAGGTGGYNYFWLNQGTTFTVVDGQIRTSIVVDPPDGHAPPYNETARKRMATGVGCDDLIQCGVEVRAATPTSDARESQDTQFIQATGSFDNPEERTLGERCLLGFGSTSGPPALPDYFYNDLHQIVQTPDSIMILTEMVHDARIIRMNAQHLPKNIRRWMGDPVGHWEGDTLVVDTTNFNDKTRFRGSTERLHVIERFSRIDDKTLLYRFTVEDPDTWDKPWTGEYTWPATTKPIYEYACHEGNYALGDVLRGARHQEALEAAAKK